MHYGPKNKKKASHYQSHFNFRLDAEIAMDIKDACVVASVPSLSVFFRRAALLYLAYIKPSILLRRRRGDIETLLANSYPNIKLYFTGPTAQGREKPQEDSGAIVDCLIEGDVDVKKIQRDLAKIVPGANFRFLIVGNAQALGSPSSNAYTVQDAPFLHIIDDIDG